MRTELGRKSVAVVMASLALCSMAVAACGSASQSSRGSTAQRSTAQTAKRSAWRPRDVVARLMVEPLARGIVRRGTVVRSAGLGIRAFADDRHGYSLAEIEAVTYPARTVNGGMTWRIDGPVFHRPAAQGAVAVDEIGVVSANTAFAWLGLETNTVVDVTTDGGQHWWQAFFPGSVLSVDGVPGEVIAKVQRSVPEGHTTHRGLWVYRTTTGHRWSYLGRVPPD